MKSFIAPVVAMLMASTTFATVSVQVYRADEVSPLEWVDPNEPDVYKDIMVGTRLTLFVVSDATVSMWSGGLQIPLDDWSRGTFSGRGYDPYTRTCADSILPAAGDYAYINLLIDANDTNPHCSLAVEDALAGEWFVLDYHAHALGTCGVGLYSIQSDNEPLSDYIVNLYDYFEPPPVLPGVKTVWIQGLFFNHVPSRDYDGDSIVNLVDFALWAEQWRQRSKPDPNEALLGDLNADDRLDALDLASFCGFWLERTDTAAPAPDPNDTDETP